MCAFRTGMSKFCCHRLVSPDVSMSEPDKASDETRLGVKTDEHTEVHRIQVTGDLAVQDEKLREMFDAIDTDKDGRLSLDELIKWYHVMGLNPTQEEVKTVLDQCDANGSTYIEYDEYKDKLKIRMDAAVAERDSLMNAFRTLDKKAEGTVSCLTLRTVLTGTGDALDDEWIDEIFRDMDVKKDGVVIYKDLVGKICKT
ncbi:neo-calmodulin-like isoform X2 [Pecten maximus]|uniref:neo-calmodulin-like isoform X2 n=1 Tax=Pecten maximus TaxID=6579 RepID=UPI0014582FC8|nr:neo-calmodulin-like isoform X2 [Pecten maximus]